MRSASQGYLADKGTKAAIVSSVLFQATWLLHGPLHSLPLHPAIRLQVRRSHSQHMSKQLPEQLKTRIDSPHGGIVTLALCRIQHGQLNPCTDCSARCNCTS